MAALNGPEELSLNISTANIAGTVLLEVQASTRYVWPTKAERVDPVTGLMSDTDSLAEQVRTRLLPAWRERERVLADKTVRARAALQSVVGTATALIPSTRVEWGTRPSVATIRLPGGVAHLHGQGDGTVKIAALELKELDQETGLRLLAALAPAQDSVPPSARPAEPRNRLHSSLD
ncbi:hypothetical protein ACFQ0M_48255 [Kitasatospora aburaviensis]|uniref:Uncharacterized protein n=1 Tax=Kitasatospora aburaviensis TaxID=67265 RepID=A0ABW1EYQ9_9ACTN